MSASRIAIAPNTQPTFMKRGGILNSVRLINQTCLRDGTGGTPVTLYDPSINGDGNGAICEVIQIMPVGVNVATVLYLFFQLATVTPVRWDFWQELALPAVTAIPNNATLTAGGSYPLTVTLPQILFPASQTPATPNRGLRLNAEGVIWGVALGTAIAAGVNVTMFGGEL
ncbi:MAG TPA: hypothetical protein V6D33_11930 [Cyanophyceae cyanobacterium]